VSIFDRLFKRATADPVHVTDPAILDRFLRNPDFPWLISFPRTGSHWLRMIMELYFEKPGLRRVFFYPDAKDFTCYHWHDVDLETRDVKSVIYLYRHPVDTVYSQLRYHKDDFRDAERVGYWAEVYARHLSKWLFEESFTTHKTTISYEGMRSNPAAEFRKVCEHLGQTLDAERLEGALAKVSKEKLKTLTNHDDQVVNLTHEYDGERQDFRVTFAPLVLRTVTATDSRLGDLWPPSPSPDAKN